VLAQAKSKGRGNQQGTAARLMLQCSCCRTPGVSAVAKLLAVQHGTHRAVSLVPSVVSIAVLAAGVLVGSAAKA